MSCVLCKEEIKNIYPFYCTLCWAKLNRNNRITNLELINYLYLSTGKKLYFDLRKKIKLLTIYNNYKYYYPNLLPLIIILDKLLYLKMTFIDFYEKIKKDNVKPLNLELTNLI